MLNDKRSRSRAAQRKEVISTLSDDSGCVTESSDTPKTNSKEVKVDVPFVPLYHDDDDSPEERFPRIGRDKRSVRTLKVHFEFLATTPFNPLKRPNWWIGDDSGSDSESVNSEPVDVNTTITSPTLKSRPQIQRPYSSPNGHFSTTTSTSTSTDKINEKNIANNNDFVEVGAINTDTDIASDIAVITIDDGDDDEDNINDNTDNVSGMR